MVRRLGRADCQGYDGQDEAVLVLPEGVVPFPVPWLGPLAVVARLLLLYALAWLVRLPISISCSDRVTYPIGDRRERKGYAPISWRV